MKVRDRSLDALKWIAVLTMIIDHIGYAFFPEVAELRIIGRIAFPLFAFLIAQGLHNTKDKRDYIKRLLLFACAAQLPFYFLFENQLLNVLFTFAAGAIFCSVGPKYLPFYILMMFLVPFEFSWWGMLLIPSFYYFKGNEKSISVLLVFALCLFSYMEEIHLQVAAIFGFLIILNKKVLTPFEWPIMNKYFFYWFYPGHIALFAFLIRF